jgi:acetyl esterase/lipase
VAKQVLVYPMLDDRNVVPNPALAPFLTWRYEDNLTGWGALIGEAGSTGHVDPVIAPARLDDVIGLPPTYVEVGELDIFREEDVGFAVSLMGAGVPVELHVWPGANHGFDRFAPDSAVARTALAARSRAIRSF